jgi:hypothetical protein
MSVGWVRWRRARAAAIAWPAATFIPSVIVLARTPSVYQGAIDPDLSYENLWPELQAAARTMLEGIMS